MGRGVAIQFACGGYEVSLYNRTKESSSRAMDGIGFYLRAFEENGLFTGKEARKTLSLIEPTTSFEEAASGAHYVIECVSEDLPLKQDVFQRLDGLCPPSTVIATDTSGLRLSEIGQKAKRKERLIVVHHYTPPPLRPVVEVVRGRETSEETFLMTKALLESVGKEVVEVKEQLGHIGVRITTAIRREAIYMVEKGVASPEDIDRVIYGLGILPLFSGMDASGLDVLLGIHEYLQKDLDNRDHPSPLLKEKVERGELGIKSGGGFYGWSEVSAKEAVEKRIKALILRLKEREILQKSGP